MKVVELEFAESISLETVRPDTQKNELKPRQKKEWCIPKVSGEFVARMEDVLYLKHSNRMYNLGASGSVFRR